MVQDATGQTIFKHDLVMFETTTGGGRHDRGLAVRFLPGKKLSVLRVDGTVVAKKACDLTVVDRSFLCPGMGVASVSDQSRQPGVITGVSTSLDLVLLDGADEPPVVATGVSPAEVRLVKELSLGDYVVSGPWLGRLVEQSVEVDVLFDDGSVCRVTKAGDKLRHLHKTYWSNYKHGFCPGDAVAGDASIFKASRWLKGHWKPSRCEGTVVKVEMGGVLVYWVASLPGAEPASAPPAYQPNSRDLTFFCPGDATLRWFWGVGRRCFFRLPPPTPAATGRKKKHPQRRRVPRMHPGRPAEEFERAMGVADTHTTVDVLWQDGTRQRGLPSAALHRILVRNEQDFFPGQRVISKMLSPPVTADDNVATTDGRVGIVKSQSYQDQTVCVAWNTAAPGEEPSEVDTVVSTYDLRRSPDHRFFYEDIVVRLRPTGSTAGGGGANDLSWVGHIVDPSDAQFMEVKWGDGSTSKIYYYMHCPMLMKSSTTNITGHAFRVISRKSHPYMQVLLHEIAFVKRRSAAEILKELGDWVPDDDQDKDDGFDKQAQEDMPHEVDNNEDGGGGDDDNIPDRGSGTTENGPVGGTAITSKVGNIIQSVIRTVSRMLAQGKMASATRAEPATGEDVVHAKVPASNEAGDSEGRDVTFHFKHFDVGQSPQDHHYLDNNDQGNGGGRKWLKRVQKEWKILETSLPDTIYVRAFEDRMDLLRAVMVGASGTPYQDGLFFFDLQLPPSSYPATPPLVKYHSFGLRVNPNLNPSGTVCLSLLNTFGGEGAELWSPESSSILQVVVSIQGLVLTAQPYYNEAGYAAQVGTPEGRRNEIPYCENTYLVNLHTMLHLIRRPPAGFEAFVRDHFRRRGRHVVRACEAYQQEACPVGTLDGEAFATDQTSRGRSCSLGFRLALAKIVPRLVEAFAGIGAHACDDLDCIQVSHS